MALGAVKNTNVATKQPNKDFLLRVIVLNVRMISDCYFLRRFAAKEFSQSREKVAQFQTHDGEVGIETFYRIQSFHFCGFFLNHIEKAKLFEG